MKRHITHILTAAAALLAVLGCTKNEPNTNGRLITMTAHEAGATKALLDADSFMAEGNQIVVYDYYTQGPNTTTPSTGYYIPGVIAQSTGETETGTVWPFTGDTRYEWTEDGVHKFFGWLAKDNNGNTANAFFGNNFAFNTNNHTLIIPETTLSQTSTQFDFMYSAIESRKPATEGYHPVELAFNHLFTAFSIAAKDVAEYNEYIIESIQVKGMKTKCSATIDFRGDEPAVTYDGTVNPEVAFAFAPASPFQLTTELTDVATWTATREHFLAWPQEARTISIVITYKAKEVNDAAYTSYTKTVMLPFAMAPGKKNNLNLEFKDKEISLDYYIEDWITVTEEIDFSDQVTVDEENGTIKWVEGTVQTIDYVNGEVILFDDPNIEATCTFTILTPKGATYTASLIPKEGHPDAFRFVGGTKYGTVGDESTIKIVVTNEDPISPRHVAELLITVQTADGRTIVVDDALTPEEYEGEETTYTRFKIIQNLIN